MHGRLGLITFAVVAGLLACSQLLIFGYPMGHDWIFELVRIAEYRESLASGQALPFWAGNLYRGFGSPIFVFYAPLYAASASVLTMVGFSLTAAAIAVMVLVTMIAAAGMFSLVREILGDDTAVAAAAARIAAAAYVLAPYFLANMLIRNASAEFMALSLAPYAFWGLALIHSGKLSRGWLVLAISFALVILAHNLTALVVAVSLFASVLVHFLLTRRLDSVALMLSAMLVAIGLSTWFWLPALGMKSLVNIDQMLLGKFDFHNGFRTIKEIFSYGGLFAVGWLIALLVAAGAGTWFRSHYKPVVVGLVGCALLAVFLQTSMSATVWEAVPMMPLFQFPWRMLGPLSFAAAILSALFYRQYLSRFRFAEWVFVVIIIANAVPLLKQYQPLSAEFQQFVVTSLNASGIRQKGLAATVLDEYLPRGAVRAISERVPTGSFVLPRQAGVDLIAVADRSAGRAVLEVKTQSRTDVQLARWYFPVWRARVDGQEHHVAAGKFGEVTINVPAGQHELELYLAQPPLRRTGWAVSSVSLLVLGLVSIPVTRRWLADRLSRVGKWNRA